MPQVCCRLGWQATSERLLAAQIVLKTLHALLALGMDCSRD